MQKPSCSREGCTTSARSLGLCPAHYQIQNRETMRSGRRPRPERLSRREACVLAELQRRTAPVLTRELRESVAPEIASASVPLVADYLVARGLAERIQTCRGAERSFILTEAGRAFPQARIDEALA